MTAKNIKKTKKSVRDLPVKTSGVAGGKMFIIC